MIEKHVQETGSEKGQRILDHFEDYLPKFKKIIPIDYKKMVTLSTKLEEKGIQLDGIPGFYRNRDGRWEASFYEGNKGYLCPVYSLEKQITGFQIRVDKPVNHRKYMLVYQQRFEGGTSKWQPAGYPVYKPGTEGHPGNRGDFKSRACQHEKRISLYWNPWRGKL